MKQSDVLTNDKVEELILSFNALYEKTNIAYQKDNLKMVDFLEGMLKALNQKRECEDKVFVEKIAHIFAKELAAFKWFADRSL